MENNKKTTRVVTLFDLWDIFVSRLLIMILAAVIAIGAMYAAVKLSYEPRYESKATLYILKHNGDSNSAYSSDSNTSSDFTLALNVVKDCTYLLKSHAVLDRVKDNLGLDISYSDLYDSISANNPDNTRILEVTVESDSPEKAKSIVDAICTIGSDEITEAMGFKQTNFIEKGIINRNPCNVTSIAKYIIVGFIAALLVYVIFLIRFLLDDSIRTNEDVERYLELSILGDIPDVAEVSNGKYGYYRYGRKKHGGNNTSYYGKRNTTGGKNK